jgi:hypothetical protein
MANSPTPTVPAVTALPVEAAPPVRTRPPRPEKRPEIKLSEAKAESRFVGPIPLAVGLIALVATLGVAHRLLSQTEDRNYVLATESLNQYELGRVEAERNYDSSIYADALAHLADVDGSSSSAEKAAALAADIKVRTELFHRRIAARDQAERAKQEQRGERDKQYLAAREKDLVMPQKNFPECKEGSDAHAH